MRLPSRSRQKQAAEKKTTYCRTGISLSPRPTIRSRECRPGVARGACVPQKNAIMADMEMIASATLSELRFAASPMSPSNFAV